MPRSFTNEELNQRRTQIRRLNEEGQGLSDTTTRLQLEKLHNYFQYAAAAMEKDLGNKLTHKQKELALYLHRVAKSFRDLTRNDILAGDDALVADQHSDFEMALRELSDLRETLLDREPDGTLVFDLVHKYGGPIMTDDPKGKQLLGEIGNLDRILDLGLGGLAEDVAAEQGPGKKNEYLLKGQVLRFQTDPDALVAAELMDPGSEVSGTLTDFLGSLTSGKRDVKEIRDCAAAIQTLAADAAAETEPFARRELIVRTARQVGLLRQMYKARDFRQEEITMYREKTNVVFPPDPKTCRLEHGKTVLKRYFDADDQRVRNQLKELETPGVLLPAGENNSVPRMAALLSENPTEFTKADLALFRGTFWLMAKYTDALPQGELRSSLYNLGSAMKDIVAFYDDCDEDTDAEDLQKRVDAFRNRCKFIDEELAKVYQRATPQQAETIHGMFDPLLTRWQRMDLNNFPEKFKGQVGELPPAPPRQAPAPQPADEALRGQAEAEKQDNRFYSRDELSETQVEDCKAMLRRMAQGDLYTQLDRYVTGFIKELNERYRHGPDCAHPSSWKTAFNFAAQPLNSLRDFLQNLHDHPNAPINGYTAVEKIGKLRDVAAFFRMADRQQWDRDKKSYISRLQEGVKLADRLIEKSFVPGPDPLRSYVALHSGYCAGEVQKTRLECTAKAAAAYEWAVANNYRIGGKISQSEIRKQGELMLKSPVFREFFRDPTHKVTEADAELDAEKAKVNSLAMNKCIYRLRHQDLVNQRLHPMSFQAKREDQLAALKGLRELGDVLDHCSGAGKDYKNFFYSLKDLGRRDLDGMSGEELGAELDKIYKFTEKYMKGKKSVSWYKNRREHFEQALDALACLRKVSRYGEKLADQLVERTNHIREKRHQPRVSLNDRGPRQTAERLAHSRGLQGTDQSNSIIKLIEEGLRKDKLVRASEAGDPAALPALPSKLAAGETVKLADQQAKLRSFLESKGENYYNAGKNVPEILALSITPAYRNAQGEVVMSKEQYERSVRLMAQHLATDLLTSEYRYEEKRQALLNHESQNKPALLRTEFDQKNTVLTQQIKAEDDRQQGDLAGMKDEDFQKQEREEYAKRLREKKELEELKRQTEEMNKQAEKLGLEKQEFSQENEQRLLQIEEANRDYQDLNASMLGLG